MSVIIKDKQTRLCCRRRRGLRVANLICATCQKDFTRKYTTEAPRFCSRSCYVAAKLNFKKKRVADPTPDEIAERCALIQAEWGDEERVKRLRVDLRPRACVATPMRVYTTDCTTADRQI